MFVGQLFASKLFLGGLFRGSLFGVGGFSTGPVVEFSGIDRYRLTGTTDVASDVYAVATPPGATPNSTHIRQGLTSAGVLAAGFGMQRDANSFAFDVRGLDFGLSAYDLHCFSEPARPSLVRTLTSYEITQDSTTLTLPLYVSQSIFSADPAIQRAVIVVHGSNLNGDAYFDTMAEAVHGTADTVLIAPNFYESAQGESVLFWSSGWREGNRSNDTLAWRISSFAVMDDLIARLRATFVNLQKIVIVGFSAGGQYVNRYAATQTASDLQFIAGGSSSYLWMDSSRPNPQGASDNDYKYGLDNLTATGYMNDIGATALRERFAAARVIFLLSQTDNYDVGGMDTTAPAMAQGANRLERLQNYRAHLIDFYGTNILDNHEFHYLNVLGSAHSFSYVIGSHISRARILE